MGPICGAGVGGGRGVWGGGSRRRAAARPRPLSLRAGRGAARRGGGQRRRIARGAGSRTSWSDSDRRRACRHARGVTLGPRAPGGGIGAKVAAGRLGCWGPGPRPAKCDLSLCRAAGRRRGRLSGAARRCPGPGPGPESDLGQNKRPSNDGGAPSRAPGRPREARPVDIRGTQTRSEPAAGLRAGRGGTPRRLPPGFLVRPAPTTPRGFPESYNFTIYIYIYIYIN